MATLERVIVSGVGTARYLFLAPKGLYGGNIAAATGISIAVADADTPEVAIKELLQKGIVYRVIAKTILSNGRKSALKLLVAKTELQTALDTLDGISYRITGGNSGIIKSVSISTRIVSRG